MTFVFNVQIIKSVMEQHNEEPGAKYSLIAMETTEKLQRICSNIVGFCKTVMNATGWCPNKRLEIVKNLLRVTILEQGGIAQS